ncbi:M57 family metalloprotease [Myxococcus sp. CA033]|uniref:M57 family metalloprotease n=1 Tax=Myxococcus sp. CA033 TaxID=2741516 RepID=UPI0020C66CF8|nr:M57 family metalloprotease [Myxococcus sp. CA033]
MTPVRGAAPRFMGWGLLVIPLLWSCGSATGDAGGPSASPPAGESARGVVSWEEYQRSARQVVDGKEHYIVEWDLGVSLEALRERYDRYVKAEDSGERGAPEPLGTRTSPLIVNTVGGLDDIWPWASRFNLRYCVSNAFGTNKARMVNEMANAAATWRFVADVQFIYDASQDANCTNANLAVTFSVQPWTGSGACAFFPSGGGCVARTLVINIPGLDPAPPSSPNVTTATVLIHELGHILGFRHEHTRNPSPCFEDNNWRALTLYDVNSTMHYPWCNGVTTSTLNITYPDAAGAALLYGWHTNANVDRSVPATHTHNVSVTAQVAQSFYFPIDVQTNFAEGCFAAGAAPTAAHIRVGNGFAGAVAGVATSVFNTGVQCSPFGATYTWYRATFAGVSMPALSTYTVAFGTGTQPLTIAVDNNNPYSGGTLWDSVGGGRFYATADGRIRVGRLGPP